MVKQAFLTRYSQLCGKLVKPNKECSSLRGETGMPKKVHSGHYDEACQSNKVYSALCGETGQTNKVHSTFHDIVDQSDF